MEKHEMMSLEDSGQLRDKIRFFEQEPVSYTHLDVYKRQQKYPNRLIRSFFKIWRWISRCWEVRKYSFFRKRAGSVIGEIRYNSA